MEQILPQNIENQICCNTSFVNTELPCLSQIKATCDSDQQVTEIFEGSHESDCSDIPLSIQGNETDIVQDTEDTSESYVERLPNDISAVVERQEQLEGNALYEYEVLSDIDSECSIDSYSSNENCLELRLAMIILESSDEEGFYGDYDSSDSELPDWNKWNCWNCGLSNHSLVKFCCECKSDRYNWFPEESSEKNIFEEPKKTDNYDSRAAPADIFSFDTSTFNNCDIESDKCLLCWVEPRNALLVHGISAHQICCFMCGMKLKKSKKSCLVCHRPILKVVKNFFN